MTVEVLHLVPALFDRDRGIIGGAERYAFELARHMAEQVPTALVAFGERPYENRVGKLSIRILGRTHHIRGQRLNPFSMSLIPELRTANIIHCHQQHVLSSSVAALVGRLSGRRVFVTELGGGGWDISAYVSTDRWYHGHLHLSEYSKKVAGQDGWQRAFVIGGGVDIKTFVPRNVEDRGRTVVFVGRIFPHKGIDDLVNAISGNLRLDVIGPVGDTRFLRDLQHLAKGKAVRFLPAICDDEILARVYQDALCVLLPSVYKGLYGATTMVPELLGQTLLESMACGTPVICTDVASMPEVVVDKVTGFIVPPNNPAALREKIDWFEHHPSEVAEMGRAGRQRVLDHFTWPQVVQRCFQAYETAVN